MSTIRCQAPITRARGSDREVKTPAEANSVAFAADASAYLEGSATDMTRPEISSLAMVMVVVTSAKRWVQ